MADNTATNEVRTYLAQRGGSVEDSGGRGLTDEMARAIGVDRPATLTAILGQMEDDGVITREMRGLRTYRIALVDGSDAPPAPAAESRRSGRMVSGRESRAPEPAVVGAGEGGSGAVSLRDALSRRSNAANGSEQPASASGSERLEQEAPEARGAPTRARSLRDALSDRGAVLAPPEESVPASPPPRAGRSAGRAVSLRDAITSGGSSAPASPPSDYSDFSDFSDFSAYENLPAEPAWSGARPTGRSRSEAPTASWEATGRESGGGSRKSRRGVRPRLTVPVPAVKTAPTTPIMTAVGIAVAGVVLVALITVLVTRGSPPHHVAVTGTSSSSEDSCRVVTTDLATAAFGSDAGAPNFVLGSCVYDNHIYELIVEVARQNARTLFDASHSGAAQDVPGLGDAAYFVDGRLRVLKGSSLMLLTINPYSASAPSPRLLALAASAVSRL